MAFRKCSCGRLEPMQPFNCNTEYEGTCKVCLRLQPGISSRPTDYDPKILMIRKPRKPIWKMIIHGQTVYKH